MSDLVQQKRAVVATERALESNGRIDCLLLLVSFVSWEGWGGLDISGSVMREWGGGKTCVVVFPPIFFLPQRRGKSL